MTLHALHLEQPTAEVLACALLQAIDDLEARAIIAEHHDPALGSASAAEYRTDVQRLRLILGALGDDHIPTPERAAVLWIDGTWTVQAGRPVRLHRQDDLEALLESSFDLVHHGMLYAQDALIAIHHLVATDRLHLATTTDLLDHDDDLSTTHDDTTDDETLSIVSTTRDLQAPCLPTPQAAHRLAPRSQPAPGQAAETGAGRC